MKIFKKVFEMNVVTRTENYRRQNESKKNVFVEIYIIESCV
jgi:hypothetical protein